VIAIIIRIGQEKNLCAHHFIMIEPGLIVIVLG